jgi:hypothetical protein
MRRALVKLPGCAPEERTIATSEAALRELIGCTFETRVFWTDEGPGRAVILCANQKSAQALNYPDHIWFRSGTIAGPVVVIGKHQSRDGNRPEQYCDLSDDEVAQWQVRLAEFEEALASGYAHRMVTEGEERALRRRHSHWLSVRNLDDFTAVLGLQVEIEHRIRERILVKVPHPERLGENLRLDLRPALAVAAALNAIPNEIVRLIEGLGEIRNRFAHRPGYVVTPADVVRLKELAESVGLEDTRWAFDETVDETIGMSEESRDLRMIYDRVLIELDDDVIQMRSEDGA